MTRWARVTTSNSKRPLSATSWEDMKKGSAEGANQNPPSHKRCQVSGLSLRNDAPQAKHKKNKKKKEYLNEDVNGFMEYLKELTGASQWTADSSRQQRHKGRNCSGLKEGQPAGRKAAKETGSKEECNGVFPLSTTWPWNR